MSGENIPTKLARVRRASQSDRPFQKLAAPPAEIAREALLKAAVQRRAR